MADPNQRDTKSEAKTPPPPDGLVTQNSRLDNLLKIAGAALTLATFIWGIWTYRDTATRQLNSEDRQYAEQEASRKDEWAKETQLRRIDSTKPFLQRQLTLYSEAAKVTAILATSADHKEKTLAHTRFLQLYWGELALVEDASVESKMVDFKYCMDAGCSPEDLQQKALALSHACRDSLAKSWGVAAWKTPDYSGGAAGADL